MTILSSKSGIICELLIQFEEEVRAIPCGRPIGVKFRENGREKQERNGSTVGAGVGWRWVGTLASPEQEGSLPDTLFVIETWI
jgi:hypothetical protein